jgi:prepilin-type N-terminal cleavage/methylation domain-containing protein
VESSRGVGVRARIIRRLRQRRPDSGFTLIELLIALLLLAIMMTASLYAILQGLGLSRDSQDRVVASDVATQTLEQLRVTSLTSTGFATIPITTSSLPAQTIQGTTYNLNQDVEWVNRGVSSSVCNSGTNSSLILRATVTVTWGYPGESVSDTALLAPPNGALSSSDGALPVQVDNAAGTGYAGATVTATLSGNSTSITTGSDGCAFFADLPFSGSGSAYTLTVSSPGGVDSLEQPTFTAPSVSVSGTESSQFINAQAISYDTGGTINWTFAPTSPPPAAGMPISVHPVSGQGLGSLDMYSYPNSSTTGGGLNPVYPNGYDIFAGGCTDADPLGKNTSANYFYPGATATNVVVTPGGSATTTIPLYPLNLTVTAAGLTAAQVNSASGSSPTATEDPAGTTAGGGCQLTNPTYTLSAVSSGASSTGIGLGLYQINVAIPKGASTLHGSVNVWVQPNGVYAVNSSGTPTTQYYSFSGSGSVPVTVS